MVVALGLCRLSTDAPKPYYSSCYLGVERKAETAWPVAIGQGIWNFACLIDSEGQSK